jgi:putative transposase
VKVGNGPEFISRSLVAWAYFNKVKLDYSRPGPPTDNAYIESFNGSFRNECLNVNWFSKLKAFSVSNLRISNSPSKMRFHALRDK